MQILICAEDSARATLIEAGLHERPDVHDETVYVVHRVDRLSALLAGIAATNPDAIFVDLQAPSPEGLLLLSSASRVAKRPIVAFVDTSDAASVRTAVDAGVAAYVVGGLGKERIRTLLTVAISRHEAVRRLETELERARAALRERKVIERAKAILMKRERLSEQDAYTLLRRTAMNRNQRIADLARAIVDAATLLGD